MSMNIKNKEAHRLARELADLTGESLTEAVTVALKERVERVKETHTRDARLQRLMQIARECSQHMDPTFRSEDHAEMLYDELGLPR